MKKRSEKPNENEIVYHHGIPVTRRDMLKAGVIQFAAALTLPSVFHWLGGAGGLAHADAAACGTTTAGNQISAFVHLHLSGGYSSGGQMLILDKGGQPLSDYSILGQGRGVNRTTSTFANKAIFHTGSALLTGITNSALATTLAKSSIVGMPIQSQDDSRTDAFYINRLVEDAGLKGTALPNLGTEQTPTGGHGIDSFKPSSAPLIVNSYDDLANAISIAGSLGTLSQGQKVGLFRLIDRLTNSQAATLTNMSGAEQVKTLMTCASYTNETLVSSGSNGTNPIDNTTFAGVWNLNANTSRSSQDYVFGSVVYNALKGNAGSANLVMGGYDYHGNARNTTNQKDTQAGTVVGQILDSAAAMQKPLFLLLTSDGAVGAPLGSAAGSNFTADRGGGGVAYMIAYHPLKAPGAGSQQVGQMTAGQVADSSFITGSLPNAAAGIFFNYMSFNGRAGSAESIVPRAIPSDQVDKVIKIFPG
jgi:hypothetical protein